MGQNPKEPPSRSLAWGSCVSWQRAASINRPTSRSSYCTEGQTSQGVEQFLPEALHRAAPHCSTETQRSRKAAENSENNSMGNCLGTIETTIARKNFPFFGFAVQILRMQRLYKSESVLFSHHVIAHLLWLLFFSCVRSALCN